MPQVIDLLHDTDHRVRVEALHVLGELGDQTVVSQVIDMLHDREMSVRGAAVWALRALGDRRAVEPPIARLSDDTYGDVREAALLALAELADADLRLRDPLAGTYRWTSTTSQLSTLPRFGPTTWIAASPGAARRNS